MKMRMQPAILVLFVFVIYSCSTESLSNTVIIESKNVITVENELMTLVNNYRVENDLNNLEYSSIAYKYANLHTDYMISNGSTSHDNFSARASNFSSEVNATLISENVAKSYTDALSTFNAWMTSNVHKKAIEGDFTHSAVSVKTATDGTYYFTQLYYK
ncbi:CAP domain-containing protein [Cellulophaga baltica]|uniref:CAP domain-containing protein n=1 Tax=Cellulophaga baltica TaxID=76594 RepID=UPI0015F4C518|nr:CAP domain-containing protein [Cellulophaga baltica]MBA6314065.1 CAP domain-containing protein [Cellulophaga baltica]